METGLCAHLPCFLGMGAMQLSAGKQPRWCVCFSIAVHMPPDATVPLEVSTSRSMQMRWGGTHSTLRNVPSLFARLCKTCPTLWPCCIIGACNTFLEGDSSTNRPESALNLRLNHVPTSTNLCGARRLLALRIADSSLRSRLRSTGLGRSSALFDYILLVSVNTSYQPAGSYCYGPCTAA